MAEKKSWLQKFQALLDERGLRSEADLTGLTRFVHFWMLLGKSFVRNRCPIRASALSYTTLLAMIPMLAVVISVTSSLLKDEGEERIYTIVDKFITTVIPAAPDKTNQPFATAIPSSPGNTNFLADKTTAPATNVAAGISSGTNETSLPAATNAPTLTLRDERVAEAKSKIRELVADIRHTALGTIGMVLLLAVGVRMLSQVESTFNDIWGVTRGRNWVLRIVLYWTTITLGPLLLIAALGLASGPHWQFTHAVTERLPVLGPLLFSALTLVLLWLTFALFYQLVPNTKVQFSAALVGGMVAGSLWHLNNLCGFLYASRLATNVTFYGSLALIPVLMIGLYFSWFIVLFGAQVAYAFQNRTLYLQEKIAENVNQRGREFVALRLLTCIGRRFQRGLPPATIQDMSAELAIPSRLVQQVLQTLIAAHLVAETHGQEPGYTPARPLENINAHHILQAMRATNGQELVTRDEPVREEVYGEFARIQEAERQAAVTVTMLALVNRAQARLELVAPTAADAEVKMKPALVPTIAPVPESADEKNLPAHSAADDSPAFAPENSSQEKKWQGNEARMPVTEAEFTILPDPAKKAETSPPTVTTPTDDERDFPL